MSVTSPPVGAAPAATPPISEGCPLCATPLRPDQDWCLQCGAAARTRLATAPGWRVPLMGLGLVVVLALGALTAALVELAGAPPSSPPITRTLTTSAAAPAPLSPTTISPTSTTTTTTSATGSAPTVSTPTTQSQLPGANVPGTSTPRTTIPSTTIPSTTVPNK